MDKYKGTLWRDKEWHALCKAEISGLEELSDRMKKIGETIYPIVLSGLDIEANKGYRKPLLGMGAIPFAKVDLPDQNISTAVICEMMDIVEQVEKSARSIINVDDFIAEIQMNDYFQLREKIRHAIFLLAYYVMEHKKIADAGGECNLKFRVQTLALVTKTRIGGLLDCYTASQ